MIIDDFGWLTLIFDEYRRTFVLIKFPICGGKPLEASMGVKLGEISEECIIKKIIEEQKIPLK